jgi:hypothetical protein
MIGDNVYVKVQTHINDDDVKMRLSDCYTLTTLVVISIDCIGSLKSDYHTIAATTAPSISWNIISRILPIFYQIVQIYVTRRLRWLCVTIRQAHLDVIIVNMSLNFDINVITNHIVHHSIVREYRFKVNVECNMSMTENGHNNTNPSHLAVALTFYRDV